MAVFEGDVLKQTVAVAVKNKIEPAALLAVVEVESAGKSLELDGRTPCLLFERHVFYRELKAKGLSAALEKAVGLGLAHNGWRPDTQYDDQGTSQKRLALIAKAREVHDECALRSASWGVGQTMGFLAEELKFKNAQQMYAYLVSGGVPAQVSCMVREIKRKKIDGALNKHDWETFALKYNGKGFKKNKYDTKMAAAYARWKKVKLPVVEEPKPIVAPKETVPEPLSAPVAESTTPILAGTGVGVGGAGAMWGYLRTLDVQVVLFGIGIAVLVAITLYVLKKRRNNDTTPVGTLAQVDKPHEIDELPTYTVEYDGVRPKVGDVIPLNKKGGK